MCDVLIDQFYPGEKLKIGERINRFIKVKKFWENHPD